MHQAIDRIGAELLADPITQVYTFKPESDAVKRWTLEVQFKPGVTDAVGDSTVKGIKDLGITGVTGVRTGHKYWFTGNLNAERLETIATTTPYERCHPNVLLFAVSSPGT